MVLFKYRPMYIGYLQVIKIHRLIAFDKDIQGTPIVTFIVEKDGKVLPENIYLERSVEYTLDTEALKAIRNSPDWTPAIQNGKKVRSWKKQPILFTLEPEPKKK